MRKYLWIGFVAILGCLQASYIGDDGLEYPDEIPEDEVVIVDPFLTLPLHKWEKDTIYKIIANLGEKSLTDLFAVRKKMEERGHQVNHVHPLRFIGYVFSEESLRDSLLKVHGSSFKWSSFIDGYSGRMKEEAAKNNLERHVPGFSAHVGADPSRVLELIQDRNYEGLVLYLLL